MNRQAFVLAGVGLPFLACSFIPLVIFGTLYGQWGTNLIWGVVFGLGWWAVQSLGGPEQWRTAANIGLFVWAPLVLGGLFLLSRKVWQSGVERRRRAFLLLLAISCLPMVPADKAMRLYSGARVPPDLNVLIASW